MRTIVDLGLFTNENGHIFCFKLLKRINMSMTSNKGLREAIASAKEENHNEIMTHHDAIMTHHATNQPTNLPTIPTKKESPKETAPVPEKLYSSESYILADLLSELHIKNIDPKCKPITPKQNQSWAKDIEMIERIDGRSYQDIEKAIRWIKTPGQFWAPNVMSGSKLREKFPTIWAQMSQRSAGYSKTDLKVNQRTTMLDLEE